MVSRILIARGLRAFADGYLAVLLPAYVLALGYGRADVGILSTAALLGSALATLAVGRWGRRFPERWLLAFGAVLMVMTGLGFASLSSLWPLLMVAFLGPLNPGGGDVSVFLPLEHGALAGARWDRGRTALFARYGFIGSVCGAAGALAAGVPEWLVARGWVLLDALRGMFVLYAFIGALVWALYARIPRADVAAPAFAALGPSRGVVFRLAALFSLDAFAGGLVIHALLAPWLFERFGMSLAAAGTFFFCSSTFSALSQLAAAPLARRIGLLNTMVFTHIPASLCLLGAACAASLQLTLGLLLARSLLSQMDVPARSAYVMALVTPAERVAAASYTAVPRSLASAAGPAIAGFWLAAGALAAPLIACAVLKITYDLALYASFRRERLPERAMEATGSMPTAGRRAAGSHPGRG